MNTLGIVLVAIVVLILLGGVGGPYVHPGWQPGYGYGWGGNGVIGVVFIIILFLVLLGRV
jgi:Protein of unknown function (DUF3309)